MQRRDFRPQTIDGPLVEDLQQLVRMAIREELERSIDLTTAALIPNGGPGAAAVVSRNAGVAAGVELVDAIIEQFDTPIEVEPHVGDNQPLEPGVPLLTLRGPIRDLLVAERTLLNMLGRLCGIATLTAKYVRRVEHTAARVYDTRKTTPGWRRLEKYAVRCGGGHTHRMGLYDAVLIKDNHLAAAGREGRPLDAGEAVRRAREFLASAAIPGHEGMLVEVEIDRVEQLESAIRGGPDIVLLDNMSLGDLRECVQRRDLLNRGVELEASGGVNLETISSIAETGVERISVGSLTHSATQLDLGLDWL